MLTVEAPGYLRRLVDPLIDELIASVPALLLVGPRAVGKTTTGRRHARTIVRLDREAEAVAFRADPDAALRGLEEPVLLDEWQAVPDVLGAVKRTVDDDPHPGRFVLTGSVRADLDAQSWPGTGRLIRVPMVGLTMREFESRLAAQPLLEGLAERGPDSLRLPADRPDLRGYVELALRSGFPEPVLRLPPSASRYWIDSYLDQLLTRDAEYVDVRRDPNRLRRFFEALALNTAGVIEARSLYEAAGINRRTADAYEQLLRNLFVVEAVPAWTNNRLKRLVRTPKRYLVDPALAILPLGLDVNGVLRDGDLLGRVLDTFVAAQIRAEVPVCSTRPRLHHLRQEQGRREVDLLAELAGHRIVAIEIKAASAPRADAAKHLRWLREELGDRFVAGVVLHTGPHLYELGPDIVAAPICALWG
jgi:predicted AAA+ superfamily ATPase